MAILPTPNSMTGDTVTEGQFKEKLTDFITYVDELPTATDVEAAKTAAIARAEQLKTQSDQNLQTAKTELNSSISTKVEKNYFDSTLAAYQNGSLKTYPTLADANADIANIALNTKVTVLSATDGGDYYKETTNATSLKKSPYDPVLIASQDASLKAQAAQVGATDAAAIQLQNNRKLVKTMYSADVFSIAGNLSNTGTIVTGNTRKRTDYLSVRKGDVIDYSLIVTNVDPSTNPLIIWFDLNKANQTTLSTHTTAASNAEFPFRVGKVTVPADGYVVIQSQGSPQSFTDYTQQYFTKYMDEALFVRKDDLDPTDVLKKSQLNTAANALGYDAAGDAIFNKSISITDLGFVGGYYRAYAQGNLTEGQAGLTLNTAANAIRTGLLPFSKGAKIAGSILRYAGVQNVVFFNQNKEFVTFLDTRPTSGASIGPIDITVPDDGYVVIQQLSLVSTVNVTFSSKTRLLNKDDRDNTNGYISKEYMTKNFVSAGFKDITDLYKGLCDIARARITDALVVSDSAEFNGSKYVKCLPGVTFNPVRFYTGNLVKTALFIFYDADLNVLSSYVLDPGGDPSNTVLRYGLVTSPANTAFMRTCYAHSFSGTWDGVSLNASSTRLNLKMDAAGTEYYNYLVGGSYKFDVTGDSLGQGIEGSLRAAFTDTYVINASAIGGENVQDTLYRRSLNHITVKTKGLSIPNDGTTVSCSGWFDFDETFTFNPDGSYVVDAIDKSEVYSAALNSRSDYNFTYKGQTFRFNMNAKTVKQIAPLGAGPVTFDEDLVLSNNTPKLGRVCVVMMGTNGGFTKTGVSTNTETAMNNLIECFQRIYDQYNGRVLFCGYHYAPVAVRAYYRREMQRRFGEKFIDLPTFLMGRGRHLLAIDGFNSSEVTFMNTNQGVTSGGNSFIPLFSGDNTHPRTVVYRAYTNEILRRAYQLGFVDKLYQAPLLHPTGLSISGADTIATGANTSLTAAFTAGHVDSSLFTWTSSNPAVATVSTENWLTNWTTPKGNTTVVTGVSAGSVTITCKARYGGASATFTVTVT